MPTFCLTCDFKIDEAKEAIDGRQPCPRCASLKRRQDESVSEGVGAYEQTHTKGFAGGLAKRKGIRFEAKDGDSLCVTEGRYVKVNQFVDHDAKRYLKRVVDPVTGDVIREVDEPLPDHQNRGSAKKFPTD